MDNISTVCDILLMGTAVTLVVSACALFVAVIALMVRDLWRVDQEAKRFRLQRKLSDARPQGDRTTESQWQNHVDAERR